MKKCVVLFFVGMIFVSSNLFGMLTGKDPYKEAIENVLENNLNPNILIGELPPLHLCVYLGEEGLQLARKLMAAGANPYALDCNGNSIVHQMCILSSVNYVYNEFYEKLLNILFAQRLLDNLVFHKNNFGDSCLHLAAADNNSFMLDLMLGRCSKYLVVKNEKNESCLHKACIIPSVEATQIILAYYNCCTEILNHQDNDGNTPFMKLITRYHYSEKDKWAACLAVFFRYFLNLDLNLKNTNNQTVIDMIRDMIQEDNNIRDSIILAISIFLKSEYYVLHIYYAAGVFEKLKIFCKMLDIEIMFIIQSLQEKK